MKFNWKKFFRRKHDKIPDIDTNELPSLSELFSPPGAHLSSGGSNSGLGISNGSGTSSNRYITLGGSSQGCSGGGYVLTGGGGSGLGTTASLGGYTISASSVYDTSTTQTLDVKGEVNVTGDIKLKGKSLSDLIDGIEKRLAILHPNEKLEAKWEELKALGDKYRELEKEILEQTKMWEILKK